MLSTRDPASALSRAYARGPPAFSPWVLAPRNKTPQGVLFLRAVRAPGLEPGTTEV